MSTFAALAANQGVQLVTPGQLAAIPRYVAPRSAASSAAPFPMKVRDLRSDRLLIAQAKLTTALVSNKGTTLSTEEIESLVIARSMVLTALRHGGTLPWVPHNGASVRAARKVGGDRAIPSSEHGTLVLDPLGWVPSAFDATGKRIIAGARQSIRDLISAPEALRKDYSADMLGPADLAAVQGFAQQLAARAGLAVPIIVGGVVVCLGTIAAITWRSIKLHEFTSQEVRQQYATDAGIASLLARLKAGADPNKPSPLEEGAAGAMPNESWTKWIGPGIALGLAGALTATAIKLAP